MTKAFLGDCLFRIGRRRLPTQPRSARSRVQLHQGRHRRLQREPGLQEAEQRPRGNFQVPGFALEGTPKPVRTGFGGSLVGRMLKVCFGLFVITYFTEWLLE